MARKQSKVENVVQKARSDSMERASFFQKEFREDLKFWVREDRKTALKVMELVEAVLHDPFTGIGKPEPLKHLGPNIWSRRLTMEHRVVYMVGTNRIDFLMARYHY